MLRTIAQNSECRRRMAIFQQLQSPRFQRPVAKRRLDLISNRLAASRGKADTLSLLGWSAFFQDV
jgi:hypothetical protein